jgi:hypothetical protein
MVKTTFTNEINDRPKLFIVVEWDVKLYIHICILLLACLLFFDRNLHMVTFAKAIGTKENPTMVKAIFMNEINDRPSSYFFQLSNKLRNDVPFFKDKAAKVFFLRFYISQFFFPFKNS